MADVKISGLSSSTTPLAGTEVLPIVQSGITKQVSIANVTAGRSVAALNVITGAGSVSEPALTTTGDTNTGIFFPAADTIAFAEGGVESARIFSSGGVSIGNTTDPGARNLSLGALAPTSTATPNTLSLGGTYSSTPGANPKLRVFWDGSSQHGFGVSAATMDYITPAGVGHAFYQGGAYLGGFDGVGRLLVGTTDGGALFQSASSNTGVVSARIANNASTGLTSDIFQITALNHAAGTGFHIMRCYASGPAVQFAVRGDGTVYAQNTTIQSLSDIRTKENVRESEDGLNVISALRPVRFDFKEGFGNNRKNQLGFIAQEVEPVFPDAVDVVGDPDGDGPEEPYKSVGPGALIPVLVKAIQELKAELDQVKNELAVMKGLA